MLKALSSQPMKSTFYGIQHRGAIHQVIRFKHVPFKKKYKKIETSVSETTDETKKIARKFTKHFIDLQQADILGRFHPSFFTVKRKFLPDTFYVADRKVASSIAEQIQRFRKADVPLFEINPGIGLLTKELLRNGTSGIILQEMEPYFEPELKVILIRNVPFKHNSWRFCSSFQKLASNKQIIELGFFDIINNFWHLSKRYYNQVDEFLLKVPSREWTGEINSQYTGCVGSVPFIRKLTNGVASRDLVFKKGRPEFLIVLPNINFLVSCTIIRTISSNYQ